MSENKKIVNFYFLDSKSKKISFINQNHLARRIWCNDVRYLGCNKNSMSYSYLSENELLNAINYIRSYCKARATILYKIELSNSIKCELNFNSNDCEINKEKTEITFMNDINVIPSD